MRWLADRLLPGPYFVNIVPLKELERQADEWARRTTARPVPTDLNDTTVWWRAETWSNAVGAAYLQSMQRKEPAVIVGRTGQTWRVSAGYWDGGALGQGQWVAVAEPFLQRGIVWRIKPISFE